MDLIKDVLSPMASTELTWIVAYLIKKIIAMIESMQVSVKSL